MLELATIGLYGHDLGEWLNCLATISKFVTTDPVRPGNSGSLFSLYAYCQNMFGQYSGKSIAQNFAGKMS